MTVAHDAVTEDVTQTLGWDAAADPYTFDHTPSGTPRGIAVFLNQATSGDMVSGVTYGGVAMSRVQIASDTATEPWTCYCYFLGASIPTGTQTVSIDHTGGTSGTTAFYCVSVTAAADTEIGTSAIDEGDQANPSAALDTGSNSSLRYAFIRSGLPNVTDLALLTDMSAVLSEDHGASVTRLDRQTTASTGSFTIGWTSSSDDVAAIYIAIQEVAAATITMRVGNIDLGF